MVTELGRFCFSRNCLLYWRKLGVQSVRYVERRTLTLAELDYRSRSTNSPTDSPKNGARCASCFASRRLLSGLRYFSTDKGSYEGKQEGHETDSDSDEDGAATVKSSRKAKTHKQTAVQRKTSKRLLPRPSRYLFSDVKGEDELFRWERRPAKPKMKSDWYTRQMLRLTREKKIDQALEMFHNLREKNVHPSVEMFNTLISALARTGKVRRAFNLYNDMKKQGLKPTASSYSSLFTACMESPVPLHSLPRAQKLHEEITRRLGNGDLELHVITCNAAMKAFAVCGSPETAFEVYEEMQEHGITPDVHTYSMLLTACANDYCGAAAKALRVVEEMKAHGLKPDIFIYNLLLKALRNVQTLTPTDPPVGRESKVASDFGETAEAIESRINEGSDSATAHGLNKLNASNKGLSGESRGQFEAYFPGVEGFLQAMAMDDVEPDIRTFNLLLQLGGSGYDVDEVYLMEMMKEFNVKPDRVFQNAVVKQKALAGELNQAKEYVELFQAKYNVVADETTYQALAGGCVKQKQGLKLLEEMTSRALNPDAAVYGTLIARAAKRGDYVYLTELLKRMKRDEVAPNERMISVLDKAAAFFPQKPSKRADHKLKERNGFRGLYLAWKRELQMEVKEENVEDEPDEDEVTKYSHL